MNTLIVSSAILLTVLLFAVPMPCNGLQCYDCSTISLGLPIPECKDEFPDGGKGIPKKTCAAKSVCNKIKTSSNKGQIVTRGCFPDPGGIKTDSCNTASNDYGESSNCFCTTELCNGAEKKTVFTFIGLVSIGLIAKLTVECIYKL